MVHLMVRVVSPDFDNWLNAVQGAEAGLREHGINDWIIYRDISNPNAGMAHFMAEDMGRAMQFFQSDVFKRANAAAQVMEREFYVADKK